MKKADTSNVWQRLLANTFFLNGVILFFYILAGKFGLAFASVNPSTSAIWPPTGIALATIVFFGPRVIPAIFLGAFLVNLTTTGVIATSLIIAIGNILEGILGAYLLKNYANGPKAFSSALNIFKFAILAAIIAPMISADIGVLTLSLAHLAKWSDVVSIWITWWLGDMSGCLIVTPFLLVWLPAPKMQFNLIKTFHLLLSFFVLIVITEIVFSGLFPFPYLCIPIVIWIAFWFGRRAATTATILIAVFATTYTTHGFGPFMRDYQLNQSLLLLQLFLGTLSITSLTFAALVHTIKKGTKALESYDIRFKSLIEKSFDAVVLIDASSRILYASPSVNRLLGYTPEELEGMVGFDLVDPRDRDLTIRELGKLLLKPSGVVTIEYRTIKKDKKIIWVEATGTNLLFEPNVNAVVVNFHDITERKYSNELLLKEKLLDEAMLTSIGDGIIATDNTGKIILINQAACTQLGWTKSAILSKSIYEAMPMLDSTGNLVKRTDRPMNKVLSHKKKVITSSTIYYRRKDGTKFPVRFIATPIILNKKLIGSIEVFQDITKEKEIDKAKSEFVSVASHQLRTPLTTIKWYLEEILAHKEKLDKKQTSYLNEVYAGSKRMVNLVNALLNASRLELGSVAIDVSKVDVTKIINLVLQDLHQQIKEKHITVSENYAKQLPLITADDKLLTIIIQNVLSNAVKYNKTNGKISITITHHKNEFLISVADTGYGIPQNQQAKIFSRMFRADNARNIEPDGTGLGLYIIKEIVDSVGGKIWFESKENVGTTMHISLPASGMHQKAGSTELM